MSATATPDVEIDAIKALDFPLVCSITINEKHDTCGNTADWLVMCRSCGSQRLACNDHIEQLRALALSQPPGLTHAGCGARGRTIDELLEILLIGARP